MKLSKISTKNLGFTLIELLVVIAIISLLSSVVLASLSGARESAKVTRIVSDLNQIETAMTMWMQGEGYTRWPNDSNYTVTDGDVVRLSNLMADSNFSNYINSAPEDPIGDGYYAYDNENDTYSCGGTISNGVNIYMRGIPTSVQEQVDDIIDSDDNLACGKVTGSGQNLIYKISYDESF